MNVITACHRRQILIDVWYTHNPFFVEWKRNCFLSYIQALFADIQSFVIEEGLDNDALYPVQLMELTEKEYKGFNCLTRAPQVALYPGLLVQLTGQPAQNYVVWILQNVHSDNFLKRKCQIFFCNPCSLVTS